TALLVEARYLQRAGMADCLQRLIIDGRCRLTTPFHQAAGRLRELARGDAAHGSCGVGVGETVRHDLAHPDLTLRYADLLTPARALEQLEAIRTSLLAAVERDGVPDDAPPGWHEERAVLRDGALAHRWLAQTRELAHAAPPAAQADVAARLHRPGAVLFEGAQGVLLDEWRGFHPYTTWSTIHTSAVAAVAHDAGQHGRIEHYGALRSYLTRHGNGPFPSHDQRLDMLPEPHNSAGGWQGMFRRGHPDLVLLRYALAAIGQLDGLLVSHLDAFDRAPGLRWCAGYAAPLAARDAALCQRDAQGAIVELRCGARGDLDHQSDLTALLMDAAPQLAAQPIAGAASFIAQLEQATGLPVAWGAYGPTWETVRRLP
ncbi:MAG: adenylosuccinate synthetase, partial [Duganella sp.]